MVSVCFCCFSRFTTSFCFDSRHPHSYASYMHKGEGVGGGFDPPPLPTGKICIRWAEERENWKHQAKQENEANKRNRLDHTRNPIQPVRVCMNGYVFRIYDLVCCSSIQLCRKSACSVKAAVSYIYFLYRFQQCTYRPCYLVLFTTFGLASLLRRLAV